MSESPTRIRLFEAGQMKLLVLYFIAQAPKFSYDIIKAIAAFVGGTYKPSTGTISPTLNYLEQQHYVEVIITEDQRKQYHITAQGRIHLETQQGQLNKVLSRFHTRHQIQNNSELIEIKRAMENLKTALRLKIQHEQLSPHQVHAIAEKIDQAAVDISRLTPLEVQP